MQEARHMRGGEGRNTQGGPTKPPEGRKPRTEKPTEKNRHLGRKKLKTRKHQKNTPTENPRGSHATKPKRKVSVLSSVIPETKNKKQPAHSSRRSQSTAKNVKSNSQRSRPHRRKQEREKKQKKKTEKKKNKRNTFQRVTEKSNSTYSPGVKPYSTLQRLTPQKEAKG